MPVLFAILFSAFSITGARASDTANNSSADLQPNILLLLADDLGYNDSAIYQDIYHQQPVAAMPALQTLAKDGIRFTRFYTESTCSASRVALLTGQYAARQGFVPAGRGISSDIITLPEFLKAHGYATHHVGKWHMGEINSEAFPLNQGFDSSFGFLNQWMLKGPDANGDVQLKSPTYMNPWLINERLISENISTHRSSYKQYNGHLEDLLTQETLKLIRDGASINKKPWFIYHAFFAPHTPEEPAERFANRFPDTREGKYQAQLAQLDDSLLQIINALKQTHQWDNTIVIFASDNGAPAMHSNSNAPFSGGKAAYDEGGVRTPLVVKWQKSLDKQVTRSDPVSIMDIYPSLAASLKSRPSMERGLGFDGVPSLMSSWKDRTRSAPLFFLTFDELSVLDKRGERRLIKRWDNRKFTETKELSYDTHSQVKEIQPDLFTQFKKLFLQEKDGLLEDFLQWKKRIHAAPTSFTALNDKGAGELIGSNFLRAPVNSAYSIAFSFTAYNVSKTQVLLYQQGLTEVSIIDGTLTANMNGLVVHHSNILAMQCYSVILSGEFYDRYSTLQGNTRESQLHLIVNGKESELARGKINSLEKVDINASTLVGFQDINNKVFFNGEISKPQVFTSQLLVNDKPLPSDIDDVLKGLCQ